MELEKRYDKEEKKNRIASVFSTLSTVGLIIAILFSFGLYYQNPPPPEMSIDVVFGDPDAGMPGDPSTDPSSSQSDPSSSVPDQDLTQDIDDAPSINQNPANPTQPTTETQNPQTTPKRNIRLPNLNGKTPPGGDGENNQPGQQGEVDGGKDGAFTGENGPGGEGLGGRKATKKPMGAATCTLKGEIKVRITVDARGKVTKAEYVAAGSTTTNNTCVREAIDLAKTWEFQPAASGSGSVTDIITIILQ